MKPTSYLCNIARGAIIDEKALTTALREGTIAGAGLDVLKKSLCRQQDLGNAKRDHYSACSGTNSLLL